MSNHNDKIGELALAQDTYTKNFKVVSPLYGRKDPTDYTTTKMFQR